MEIDRTESGVFSGLYSMLFEDNYFLRLCCFK